MAWEDRTVNELRAIASEHEVQLTSSMTKDEIVAALEAAGLAEPGNFEVSGAQPVPHVPNIPITRADFAQLLENPELPAQNQSAPPIDQLNPHLFRQR